MEQGKWEEGIFIMYPYFVLRGFIYGWTAL